MTLLEVHLLFARPPWRLLIALLLLSLSAHQNVVQGFSISRLPHDAARTMRTITTTGTPPHQYDCWKSSQSNYFAWKMAAAGADDYGSDDDDVEKDDDLLDYLSPSQVKTLRKEAAKRQAAKVLPRIAYHNDVGITPIMLICSTFASHELVTISSIYNSRGGDKDNNNNSSNNNKGPRSSVKPAAEQLAFDLSRAMQNKQPVLLVSIQGYSATYYSPFPEARVAKNRIALHSSSYKPNQWSKRPKAPRDERGQIIQEQ
jgi:hypothetical protein